MNELHSRYSDKGLVILGVPCNQFGHQVCVVVLMMKASCAVIRMQLHMPFTLDFIWPSVGW